MLVKFCNQEDYEKTDGMLAPYVLLSNGFKFDAMFMLITERLQWGQLINEAQICFMKIKCSCGTMSTLS